MKKNAKKFAHIKKKLYLCTRFQNKEIGNNKKETKKLLNYEQKVLHKQPRRDYIEHRHN